MVSSLQCLAWHQVDQGCCNLYVLDMLTLQVQSYMFLCNVCFLNVLHVSSWCGSEQILAKTFIYFCFLCYYADVSLALAQGQANLHFQVKLVAHEADTCLLLQHTLDAFTHLASKFCLLTSVREAQLDRRGEEVRRPANKAHRFLPTQQVLEELQFFTRSCLAHCVTVEDFFASAFWKSGKKKTRVL